MEKEKDWWVVLSLPGSVDAPRYTSEEIVKAHKKDSLDRIGKMPIEELRGKLGYK